MTRVLVASGDGALAVRLGAAWEEDEGPEIHRLARTARLAHALRERGPWDLLVVSAADHPETLLAEAAVAAPEVRVVIAPADADGPVLRGLVEEKLAAIAPVRGRITAVIGVSGGAGRTTVALALADLVARGGERAAVVDASLQFGTVGAALVRPAMRTITDVLYDERGREQDAAIIAETLAELAACAITAEDGFAVLAAPHDPVEADRISPDQLTQVIAALAQSLDRVVVDTAAGLGAETLAVLDVADEVVIVATLDVPGMAALRTVDALLDQLGISATARHLLLNKELEGTGLPGRQAAQALDRQAVGVVPFDPEIVRARNHGRIATALPGPGADALRKALAAVAPAAAVAGGDRAPIARTAASRRLALPRTRPAVTGEGTPS